MLLGLRPSQLLASGHSSQPKRKHCAATRAARIDDSLVQTPHRGYHFDGSSRRFFEGWYYKVTIPENGQSFALIYSVEDPGLPGSKAGGVGVQVMGPDDGYICQHTRSVSGFWADQNSLTLGATLQSRRSSPTGQRGGPSNSMLSKEEFNRRVETGFQASSTFQQGSIVADESSAPGDALSTTASASWEVAIKPIYGWGGGDSSRGGGSSNGGSRAIGSSSENAGGLGGLFANATSQKATAGWVSLLAVFEPHWQVLMSHGLASGHLQWGDTRYEFRDAPSYGEKNWGGGFPSKWHWVQCNTFVGQPNLSVTAVGARRQLLLGLQGSEEDVGMIGIHLDGQFIELVPWTGEVSWDVDPWGRWLITASGPGYEARLEAECDAGAGQVLRAPTSTDGLAAFCKDTFFGRCRLQLWKRDGSGRRSDTPIVDAYSTTAALEVGGGPWWSAWRTKAEMKEPMRSLVQLPLDVSAISKLIPSQLRPPGV
ncbi:MAG: hypothetical protein WDW36_000698 [Sanguina aurantia]